MFEPIFTNIKYIIMININLFKSFWDKQLTMPKFTLHLFCYVTKKHYIKKDVLLKGFTSKGCFTEKLYIRSQR